jgi:hypothetical protein
MLNNDEMLCKLYDKPKVLHCTHATLKKVMVCFKGIITCTFLQEQRGDTITRKASCHVRFYTAGF